MSDNLRPGAVGTKVPHTSSHGIPPQSLQKDLHEAEAEGVPHMEMSGTRNSILTRATANILKTMMLKPSNGMFKHMAQQRERHVLLLLLLLAILRFLNRMTRTLS